MSGKLSDMYVSPKNVFTKMKYSFHIQMCVAFYIKILLTNQKLNL